jgi:hypothetical protein
MIKLDAKNLKEIITSYISAFKSTSSVTAEIMNFSQDQNKVIVEGNYWVGFSNQKYAFRAVLDTALNLLEMNLNYSEKKS